MFAGRLLEICIAPDAGKPMQSLQQVEAVAGQGLEGDRYAELRGTFQKGETESLPRRQVSLIEREAILSATNKYELDFNHATTRRNLLTEGVPLNHLVGKTFTIGEVTLRGIDLCEPCGYLEKITVEGIEKSLLHRGGLRAEIVSGGTLRVGDTVRPEQA